MTQLRKLMLEEIQCRNFTESTTRAYLRIIGCVAPRGTHVAPSGVRCGHRANFWQFGAHAR